MEFFIWAYKKNTTVYSVDGEVGRFSFDTYSLVNAFDEEWYNTSREFFPPLQGTENYRTEGFNEIALIYGTTEESFRKTAQLINLVRHQEEGGTPSRTLKDSTEKEGKQLQQYLEEKTQSILMKFRNFKRHYFEFNYDWDKLDYLEKNSFR